MNNIPLTHTFSRNNLHLFELNQIFQINNIWFKKGMDNYKATFDLFIRDLPDKRNFLLFGGLEEIIKGILEWEYSKDEIEFLTKNKIITKDFAKVLVNFKFSGDIFAMPEGTVFFPNEPVIRITAPIVEANSFSMFLMNSLVSNTIFLSKFARLITAARGKPVFSSGIRAHSFESAMKATRAGYLAGVDSISLPSFYRKYNCQMKLKPPLVTAYHAYIQSFDNEYSAMKAVEEVYPNRTLTMIDTYNIHKGLKNAIKLGKELKQKGKTLAGIIIDSGDLYKNAKLVRKELDKENLKDVKICLASNIDEYKIDYLEKKNTPVDSYISVTETTTSSDAPKLEAVYKLAEIDDGRKIRSTIKLAKGKLSLPGKKQVFRKENSTFFTEDIIGFEQEKLEKPILKQIVKNGKLIQKLPVFSNIKSYIKKQIEKTPKNLLNVNKKSIYKVGISTKIRKKISRIRREKES